MEISELVDGQCLRVPLSVLRDAPWGNVRKEQRDPIEYGRLKDDIAIQGVTQPITLTGEIIVEGDRATATFTAELLRSDFGIGDGNPAVSPRVTVTTQISAVQVAPN